MKMLFVAHVLADRFGDYISCLEVEIWVGQLQSEDGHRPHWNVIKEDAIVRVAFTKISLAVHRKSVK